MPSFESVNTSSIWAPGDEVVDPTIDIPDNSGVYGHYPKKYGRPEQLAPSQEDAGGFLFLPNSVKPEMLAQLVDIAGLGNTSWHVNNRYGLQVIDAPEGLEAQLGYMRKVVIADRFALRHLFGTINNHEYENYPQQPLDATEAVQAFVESERNKYGTLFGSPGLAGKFGGNGHYAQEELGFGFAIENSYYKVISIWSRGWLCTK